MVNNYRISDEVESLRFADMLDESRHENFPDDSSVIFIKKDLQIEKCGLELMWIKTV